AASSSASRKRTHSERMSGGGPAKRERPREMKDETSTATPSTPKCLHCPMYPSTSTGYAKHLAKHHQSTLREEGIYIICSCGIRVTSETHNPKHSPMCDRRRFTSHKLEQKICPSTPQCIFPLCDAYPSSIAAFSKHLYKHHQSTLKKSDIYLQCACGDNVFYEHQHLNRTEKCDGKFTLHVTESEEDNEQTDEEVEEEAEEEEKDE
ncbi:hypothetical protein PENTCL1PPCAC_30310, partial [Pristionchus entomophagus]